MVEEEMEVVVVEEEAPSFRLLAAVGEHPRGVRWAAMAENCLACGDDHHEERHRRLDLNSAVTGGGGSGRGIDRTSRVRALVTAPAAHAGSVMTAPAAHAGSVMTAPAAHVPAASRPSSI